MLANVPRQCSQETLEQFCDGAELFVETFSSLVGTIPVIFYVEKAKTVCF
jgi:hypothetical protein